MKKDAMLCCAVVIDHPDFADDVVRFEWMALSEIRKTATGLSNSKCLRFVPWQIIDVSGYPIVSHSFEGLVFIDDDAIYKLSSGKYEVVREV